MEYPTSVPLGLPTSREAVRALASQHPAVPSALITYWYNKGRADAAATAGPATATAGPYLQLSASEPPPATAAPRQPWATQQPWTAEPQPVLTPRPETAAPPAQPTRKPWMPQFTLPPSFTRPPKDPLKTRRPPKKIYQDIISLRTPMPSTSAPSATRGGPHTGALLAKLPVEDLKKSGGGSWAGRVKMNASSVTTFQGQPAVKVFYKKGSGTSGMAHRDSSGCSFTSENRAIKGQTGVVVAFDVFFDPKNWHWSKGGKIGGLFVGPGVASGYRHSENGASHRMMWQRDGAAISYIYPPSKMAQVDPDLKPEGHGVGYFGKDKFPAGTLKVGQWNRIEIGVKVNTFTNGKPNPDGKSVLTINGVSGVLTNIRWAARPDLKIDNFNYGTFFGGPDPAVVDSVSYVRNFEVFQWKD